MAYDSMYAHIHQLQYLNGTGISFPTPEKVFDGRYKQKIHIYGILQQAFRKMQTDAASLCGPPCGGCCRGKLYVQKVRPAAVSRSTTKRALRRSIAERRQERPQPSLFLHGPSHDKICSTDSIG